MEPNQLIEKLKDDGDLDEWISVISEGDKEFVTSTWYNMAMELADDIEHQMCDITRSMWELGLQAFDWDHLYDLMTKLTQSQ